KRAWRYVLFYVSFAVPHCIPKAFHLGRRHAVIAPGNANTKRNRADRRIERMKQLLGWIAILAVHEETTMGSGSILVTHPHNIQQAISFRSGRLRVGSAPDNDVIIAGPEIAPHHATITRDERGHLIVEVAAENIAGQRPKCVNVRP